MENKAIDNNQDGSLKNNLWKIYLFKFFSSLHFIGGVLVPFFLDWGRISFTQVMILQSWFMFSIFLFEIPTGTIADYFGRKQSLLLAMVVNIIAALIYGSIPNFFAFMLGETLWAISVALVSGADEALVYDTLKIAGEAKMSKKVFGRSESFHLAGLMVAAPVGSVMASQLGLNVPMLMLAVPMSIAFIIGLTFKEPRISSRPKRKRYWEIIATGIKTFRGDRILKVLALDMIFIGTVGYFMIWLYQPMLTQAGVAIIYFGIVNSAFVFSEILIMNNFERIENILGSKRRLIFFSSAITGMMFILGGLTTFIPLVLLAILVGGGFSLSRKPLFSSYMNKYIPSEQRATVMSTISMLQRLSIAVVNPFVGYLAELSLNYTLILLGVAALLFSFISRVEESHLID
jgi:MFS family permease